MMKEISMLRWTLLLTIMLVFLSACGGGPPASPTLDATLVTYTPIPTQTVSIEELTAAATYFRTLPPTFTPTYTPSVTTIPDDTNTPGPTFTHTPLPEILLCPGFVESDLDAQSGVVGVEFRVPFDMPVFIEIFDADSGALVDSTLIEGQDIAGIIFDPQSLPAGDYRWRATLQDTNDETRTGLCPLEGEFTIVAPTQTPTPRPITPTVPPTRTPAPTETSEA